MNPDEHNIDPAHPIDSSSGQAYLRGRHSQPAPRPTHALSSSHNEPAQSSPETASPQVQNPQAYDWQQYHTAWQQYYQQYYHRYYANFIATQQAPQAPEPDEPKPEAPAALDKTIVGSDTIALPKSRLQQLRDDLRARVGERAHKLRRSSHFVPIISAFIVGALFMLLQFNRLLAAQVEAYISPGSTVDASDTIIVDPSASTDIGQDPKLLIPKINVNVPVVYDVATVDDRAIQTGLEKGVVRYNLSGANSLPGQTGNMVILGHSSNDVFDPGGYKFTFVLLDRLQIGDLFYLHYQGKRYVYKVGDRKIIKPTEWKTLQQNGGKPTVILVTCNPPGTSGHRLLVYGEQISPDPASASAKPATSQETNPAEIPGNSKTFFERLGDILF